MVVAGDLAYLAGSRLRVVDVSDPTAPLEVASLDTPGSTLDLALDGSLLYLAQGSSGLQVVDVSTPTPQLIGSLDTPGSASDLAVVGSLLALGDAPRELRVIDVSDPTHPVELGATSLSANGFDVAAFSDFAYVANRAAGLRVVDFSDPTRPFERSVLDEPSEAQGVAVVGGTAYVVDLSLGLRVIDVSDPASPFEVGALDTPGEGREVVVVEGLAYLAAGSAGLRVIDVSDPEHPVELGFLDTPGDARDVEVRDGVAYVADGASGLRVIDVWDPAALREVGALPIVKGFARDVELAEGIAYVATGGFDFATGTFAGLLIVDVSDPSRPLQIGVYDAHPAMATAAAEGLLYVAASHEGLRILDVSNPEAPFELGAWEVFREPTIFEVDEVELDGEHAYLTGGGFAAGLAVWAIDVSDPSAPRPLGAYPLATAQADLELASGLVFVASFALSILDFGPEFASVQTIDIDVKPGNSRNVMNPRSRGVVPVAMLGSEGFEAAEIDPTTLAFGPGDAAASQRSGHLDDTNGDGYLDLVVHFPVSDAQIAPGDREVCLRGETRAGIRFEGCDSLTPVPAARAGPRVRFRWGGRQPDQTSSSSAVPSDSGPRRRRAEHVP